MSDTASTAKHQQAQRPGLVLSMLTMPFRLFGVLVGSLLISIVIFVAGLMATRLWTDRDSSP